MCFKPSPRPRTKCGDPGKWVQTRADELAVEMGFWFDESQAAYVVEWFARYLKHSKGRWAGQAFELLDWQRRDIVYPLFGWFRDVGIRRFQRAYIEIPKKNGKSTLASGVGLYMLAGDGENGPEVYSCATDKDQASIVHGEAINMVEASEELSAHLKVNRTTRNITYEDKRGTYKSVSAKPQGKEGLNGNCWIADELHAWYGDELWNALRYMGTARTNPLGFQITTAGDDMESICRRQHEFAKEVVAGTNGASDATVRFFGYIRGLEPGDDFDTHEARAKANPSLGDTMQESELIADVEEARKSPSQMASCLRYRFNVWSTSSNPWLSLDAWKACEERFKEEDLIGQPCWAGLDLSRTKDFTSFAMIFHHEATNTYRLVNRYWLPERTAQDRKSLASYLVWAEQGYISLIPGDTVSYQVVEDDVCALLDKFNVRELAYDKKYAYDIARRIQEKCSTVLMEVPQTPLHLAAPIQEFARMVMRGQLKHNANPVTTWQASHVQCRKGRDGKDEILQKPESANDHRTIDGIQAGVMALCRSMLSPVVVSRYETEGIRYL